MKPRTLIPLIVGLAVGFFAIKMGIDMVQKAKGAQGDQVSVLVSAKAIDVATPIAETMLTTKQVPRALLPSDTFTDQKNLRGRVTAMCIASGVPITASMLAAPGAEPGLRAKIPPGLRAVSLSVTEESAVAGFLMPGNRVDVYTGGDKEGTKSQLILSDVEVGAVGQSMNEVDKDGKTVRITKSVTLFMRPEEVERLPASRKNMRLAMRGNNGAAGSGGDDSGAGFWGTVLAKAMEPAAKPQAAAPEAPASRQRSLEVVRGADVETMVFVEKGRGQYVLVSTSASSGQQTTKNGDRAKSGHAPSPE